MKTSVRAMFVAGSLLACSLAFAPVHAAELRVLISGGFKAAFDELSQQYTAKTGNTLVAVSSPSMGKTPEAIPNRLARHEPADVVIMVGYALDGLIKNKQVDPASRVELADSAIGMVVKKGHPKPDISTVDAFKNTLLHAKSIAYSDSASGVYIEKEMYKKLGIQDQLKSKSTMVPKIPVASQVAEGKYEIGFQQVAELLPVPGVTFVGKIPASVQSITRYAGGVPVASAHPKEAAELLKFLASPQARPVVQSTGLDPITSK
jgi:molybdate transport system substrate-binding protein